MGRKSANKEKILKIASLLFWAKGYAAVGVDDICREAEINKGTLYHFYKSKQEIVLAVIANNSKIVFDLIDTLKDLGPRERILTLHDQIKEVQHEHFLATIQVAGCPFGSLSVEMAGNDKAIREAVNDFFEKMYQFLSDAIAELKNIDIEKAKSEAIELYTYWQGSYVMAKTANSVVPFDRARNYTMRMLEREF